MLRSELLPLPCEILCTYGCIPGVVSHSDNDTSADETVMEATLRPGGNITLHCDLKFSRGIYILWYRQCMPRKRFNFIHYRRNENIIWDSWENRNPFPNLKYVKNSSTDTYDLVIMNITDLDECLYYCGTKRPNGDNSVTYTFGNIITRIIISTFFSQIFLYTQNVFIHLQ